MTKLDFTGIKEFFIFILFLFKAPFLPKPYYTKPTISNIFLPLLYFYFLKIQNLIHISSSFKLS